MLPHRHYTQMVHLLTKYMLTRLAERDTLVFMK